MPSILTNNTPGLHAVSSSPEVTAEPPEGRDNEIKLYMQTGKAPGSCEFTVFLYKEPQGIADGRILPGRKVYYNSLLCAIHMQVHFMAAETIDAKANVEKVHTFEVFGQARDPSTVELFSSAPGFVYVPKRLPQVMRMEPGVQNRLQLAVKTMAEGTMSVHVTCVDVNTKILVGSWLLMINSTAPSPDAEMETEATVGKKEF